MEYAGNVGIELAAVTCDFKEAENAFRLPALAGLANPAGFKADDLPLALRIAHIYPRVAKTAGDIFPLGVAAGSLGTRGDQRRSPVEAHLAV